MVAWGIVAVLVLVLLALAFGAFHFEQPPSGLFPTFSIEPGGVSRGMSRELWDQRSAETAAAMAASRNAGRFGVIPIGPAPALGSLTLGGVS